MKVIKMSKVIKISKKVLIIILTIMCFILLVIFGFRQYFMLSVNDYYKNSSRTFVIPGLQDGLITQGLCYEKEKDVFLVSGYMNNGSASRVYSVNKSLNKMEKYVSLLDENGKEYKGHVGGIAINCNYIYIAGGQDCNLYVYSYLDFNEAKSGDSISCVGTFDLKVSGDNYLGIAFVTIKDDELIVGEFYRAKNYETLESHKLYTKAGDYNQALALTYKFSSESISKYGLNPIPNKAYSLPNLVQGMSYNQNKFYLSTSYGLAFSHINIYDESKLVYQKDIEVLNATLPLYAFDSTSLIKRIKIPPMSEEIEFVDNKLYTMCESASSKYIFGKFLSAKWCYATNINAMI